MLIGASTGPRRAALLVVCALALSAAPAGGATRSPHRLADQNRAAARRGAAHLLAQLRLPSGAVSSAQEPAGDAGILGEPPQRPATPALVQRTGWWRLRQTPAEVLRFIRAHPPAAGRLSLSGSGFRGSRSSQFIGFAWPPVRGVLGTRELLVEVVALADGTTGLRADAQVVWIVPRSASEKVPAGVKEVDIVRQVHGRPPSVSLKVTRRSRVRSIVNLINALPIVQPGAVACPAFLRTNVPTVTFTFRARAGGPALATASEPADVAEPTTACAPLEFSIRGRRQTPLLRGAAFLRSVQRLLGVTLAQRP